MNDIVPRQFLGSQKQAELDTATGGWHATGEGQFAAICFLLLLSSVSTHDKN